MPPERDRRHALRAQAADGAGTLRAVVTGASGLVGRALVAFLAGGGHRVDRLGRRPPVAGTTDIQWDPAARRLDPALLEGADAVVHLAGENVAGGRWTATRKEMIRRSRVEGTRLLAETLARLRHPPRVLVSVSATGYYGERGEEVLTEESPAGTGFLAEVCGAWEAAVEPARGAGIRVVIPRIGIVLAARGGALARLVLPFKLGLGGVIGSGCQYMSWIGLDDLVRVLDFAVRVDGVTGPVNAVAPAPVTNREFVHALGRVLGRPTLLPLPAFAVRALLGEMGQALLLDGARVRPARLEAAGFRFLEPGLEGALRRALGE